VSCAALPRLGLGIGLSAVYTLQQGRIAKAEYFFDHAKALDAVGLSE
jgi:hypothetical protein